MAFDDIVRNPHFRDVSNRPVQRGNSYPKQRPPHEPMSPQGRARRVRCTQYFWLDMPVAFTGTLGEQKQAATLPKNFPLLIRGAWSDLTDPRVQLTNNSTGVPLSTLQVPLLTLAGNTDLVHPLLFWRRPFLLKANTSLRGSFLNDGDEDAGDVVFFCERPDLDFEVPVIETASYELLLELGLDGVASSTGNTQTQQVEYDLLIYGALSTSIGITAQFTDTRLNQAWSSDELPIGAFAGVVGNPQPIVYYSTPYFLPRNTSIKVKFTNNADDPETGKFISFICERILQ